MYLQALEGGLLIGVAASLLLLFNGQIAGISGVLGSLVEGRGGSWRWLFLGGLIAAVLIVRLAGGSVPGQLDLSWPVLVGSGLLVGFGTRLGSGCTSGHGLCGLGNLSTRSLVATLIFMGVGFVTVFVVRHVLPHLAGGA
ncbi:MAG TPA: YeeE/YedE family protein [Nevskia sp.]|nr:YeeE/YedE family protein [Nevskia sp.]